MRQLRGFCSRYLFTVFFDSFTSTASTTSPWSRNSLSKLSTSGCSRRQYGHHVVQNCSRATWPFSESLVNFSPAVVLALKRGAGSRPPASTLIARQMTAPMGTPTVSPPTFESVARALGLATEDFEGSIPLNEWANRNKEQK